MGGRGANIEAVHTSEEAREVGGVGRTVVAQPLDTMRSGDRIESMLDAERHEVADVGADEVLASTDPRHDLAVAAVETEGDVNESVR